VTREEYLSLPVPLQIRLLVDALDEDTFRTLLAQEKPAIPKPPRYDLAIYRSGGNSWASEHSIEGLVWWRNRYQAGADGGGQYAEQDKKRVANLDKWIAWREVFPEACWSGKRNDDDVVARAPVDKPIVYPRPNSNGQRKPPPQQQQEDTDPDNFNF
jgi:hypothetical protein